MDRPQETGYSGSSDPARGFSSPTPGYGEAVPPGGGTDPMSGSFGTGGSFDPWRYRDEEFAGNNDLVGYKIEAADGSIGKVDAASNEVDASHLVIDTGPWILGKKVLLPAGTVNHVDHAEKRVYVDRTKEQIKSAPEFDPDTYSDQNYRDKVGGYYSDTYGSSRAPTDQRGDRLV